MLISPAQDLMNKTYLKEQIFREKNIMMKSPKHLAIARIKNLKNFLNIISIYYLFYILGFEYHFERHFSNFKNDQNSCMHLYRLCFHSEEPRVPEELRKDRKSPQ